MSTKALPSDLPIYSFASATEFESFLQREHATAPGLYLKLAKKSSGIASISAAEAVETALCFGWIDGRANRLDDDWWSVRYTPRRTRSMWSQKNVNTIGRLMEQGRMRPAGLATVEAAKADGRWDRAYAGPATIVVPDDLTTALAADAAAAAFFAGMNKSDRYAVLWRVQTASPQSRAKRIEVLVQTLAAGKRPGAAAKPSGKSKKNTSVPKATTRTTVVKKQSPSRGKLKSAVSVQDDQVKQPRREGLRRRKAKTTHMAGVIGSENKFENGQRKRTEFDQEITSSAEICHILSVNSTYETRLNDLLKEQEKHSPTDDPVIFVKDIKAKSIELTTVSMDTIIAAMKPPENERAYAKAKSSSRTSRTKKPKSKKTKSAELPKTTAVDLNKEEGIFQSSSWVRKGRCRPGEEILEQIRKQNEAEKRDKARKTDKEYVIHEL